MGNSGMSSVSVRRKTTRLSGVWRHADLYIGKRQSCPVTCKAGTWRRTALCILNPGAGRKPHAPAALPPRKRPGTNCTGGCMGLGAGLDGSGKYRQYRVSNPGPTTYTDYAFPVAYRFPAQSDSSFDYLRMESRTSSKNVGTAPEYQSKQKRILADCIQHRSVNIISDVKWL
jgi:hypothetical protein